MKLTAIFPDSNEILKCPDVRDLWYRGYHLLRNRARFETPEQFTHMDLPELGVTVARFVISENRSEDGNLHTTTCIERTVF